MKDSSIPRLCIIVENHFRGGLETVIVSLLDSYSKLPVEITLITNCTNPSLDLIREKSYKNLDILELPLFVTRSFFALNVSRGSKIDPAVVIAKDILRKILEIPLLLSSARVFRKLFVEKNFEAGLIINGGYPGSLFCRASAIGWKSNNRQSSLTMAIHNFVIPSRRGFAGVEYLVDRWVLKSITHLVTVSETCRRTFIFRKGTADRNALVIPNGIQKSNTPPSRTISFNQNTILMLASYEDRKGHEFLFKCFARVLKSVPEARLICAGDDPLNKISQLQLRTRELNIENAITLLPYQSNANDLLQMCDIVAIPSQSMESFCLVAGEALALGKPIVGTNTGAIPETAPSGHGSFLFAPDDIEGFSSALIALLLDTDLWSATSNLASLQSKRILTPEETAQKYLSLLIQS
jgi:L-malate glycosyltransferase